MTIQNKQNEQQDPALNPIINSPYEEPNRYWKLDDQGMAQPELLPGRRPSMGTNPVPRPRAPKPISMLDNPEQELALVNNLRGLVSRWRKQSYPGTTEATRKLLSHWKSDQPEPRLFFAQIEAIETLIYLFETENRPPGPWAMLQDANETYNEGFRRLATKMATGTGKTAVMALIIIWQSVNHAQNPRDNRFTNQFAVITPGITVRDRDRRDLIPNRRPNIYEDWRLIPNLKNFRNSVMNAKVSITNFHSLQQREIAWGQANSRAKRLARMETPTETGREMIKRALKELDGRNRIIVLNDEGHHCHNTTSQFVELRGEEKKTADLWFNGIREIRQTRRLHSVIDMSATPMFITKQGSRTNDQVFPWTVSDFPLTDAIESGMVKIPRVPVEDDASLEGTPVYRNIYEKSSGKTKQAKTALTSPLEPALRTMYEQYLETSKAWENAKTPPVFIIVANNVPNAQAIFEYVAGYRRDEDGKWEPGRLEAFSNIDPATLEPDRHPRTVLVHSKMDQEDKIQGTFSKTLLQQSQAFRNALPKHPWPKEDRDVMREILNTVGKEGQPGEQVRCVVSIAMLTEGWDTRTVTHVVGFRKFGTQLLCEQVAGRSLRRVVYDRTDERGFLEPEYADIMGIPFEFTFKPPRGTTRAPVDTYEVQPIEERGKYRIHWPNVTGYRTEREKDGKLEIDWEKFLPIHIAASTPELSEVKGIMGNSKMMETSHHRSNTAVFELARELTTRLEQKMLGQQSESATRRTNLFRTALAIVREGIAYEMIKVLGGATWAIGEPEHRERIANQLAEACRSEPGEQGKTIRALLDAPIAYTTREIAPYRSSKPHWHQTEKSQMNIAPCENEWELRVARTLDDHPNVTAWVRNDRQRWQIPYMYEGRWQKYEPDFIAKVGREGADLNLVIEVKGREWLSDPEKKRYTEDFWVPAVNAQEEFLEHGSWDYLYVEDPGDIHMKISRIAGGLQW